MRSHYAGDRHKGEIELVNSEKVYDNGFFEVFDDRVVFPNGTSGSYIRLKGHKPSGVLVVPVTPEGEYCLVRIFRHAVAEWTLEFPRGFMEPGESPEEAAKRELIEEVPSIVRNINYLGVIYQDSSIMENEMHVFKIGMSEISSNKVITENQRFECIQEVINIDEHNLTRLICRGEIKDAFTISAYYKWLSLRE